MKTTYELSEDEIRQAIAHFCERQGSATFIADDVIFTVEQSRDAFDRLIGSYSITATVTERGAVT